MTVTKDDPLAGRESATAEDVDLDRVIGRSGSQLTMRDIDEPGIRLEDLLGSKRFVGCGHADETIETIHSGCGAALALTPLDMDPGKLSRVVLEPFEPVTIGIGYLKQCKTDYLRALVEVLLEVYRDGDGEPVDQDGIPAGGLPPVFE